MSPSRRTLARKAFATRLPSCRKRNARRCGSISSRDMHWTRLPRSSDNLSATYGITISGDSNDSGSTCRKGAVPSDEWLKKKWDGTLDGTSASLRDSELTGFLFSRFTSTSTYFRKSSGRGKSSARSGHSMVEGKGKPEEDPRPGAGPHEEFLELCAVATSGNLTEEEKKKLNKHLATCAECQKAAKEFQDAADNAIPALAEELAPELTCEDRKEDSSFNQEAAEASFLRRLSKEKKLSPQASGEADGWLSPLVVRRSRNFRRSLERFDFWLPLAAAGLLCLALGILTYRMGKHRGVDVTRREQASAIPRDGISQDALTAAMQERDAANARLSAEDAAISALKREMNRQLNENAKLKAFQSDQEAALE